jgi:hypothetical protein
MVRFFSDWTVIFLIDVLSARRCSGARSIWHRSSTVLSMALREKAPSAGGDIRAWGYEAGFYAVVRRPPPQFESTFQQGQLRPLIGPSAASVSQTPHC